MNNNNNYIVPASGGVSTSFGISAYPIAFSNAPYYSNISTIGISASKAARTLDIKGNFFDITGVYLSAIDVSYFGLSTIYNDFFTIESLSAKRYNTSAIRRLSATNLPFSAGVVTPFLFNSTLQTVSFTLPPLTAFQVGQSFNIVIQNNSGYVANNVLITQAGVTPTPTPSQRPYTPTPTPSNTAEPTLTPTNTPTNTVTPTITPTISLTPESTVTPTPTPSVTPTIPPTPTIANTLVGGQQFLINNGVMANNNAVNNTFVLYLYPDGTWRMGTLVFSGALQPLFGPGPLGGVTYTAGNPGGTWKTDTGGTFEARLTAQTVLAPAGYSNYDLHLCGNLVTGQSTTSWFTIPNAAASPFIQIKDKKGSANILKLDLTFEIRNKFAITQKVTKYLVAGVITYATYGS